MISENIIGPNILTNPMSGAGKKMLQKHIRSWFPAEAMVETKDQMINRGKGMWFNFYDKLRDGADKYVLAAGTIAGFEEWAEEGVEGWMDAGIQHSMNGISLELAYDTKRKWEEYDFIPQTDTDTGKKFYLAVSPSGEKTKYSLEQYRDIQKDLDGANQTISSGGAYGKIDAWSGFKDEGVIAFLSAAPMGVMTHYINRNKNLEKDLTKVEYAFAELDNPKLRRTTETILNNLSNAGEAPEKFIDIEGKPIVFGSGKVSRFDVYKKSTLDEIDAYKEIITTFNLKNPALITKNGGNRSLINKAAIDIASIGNYNKELVDLNNKPNKTKTDTDRIAELGELITQKQILVDEVMKTEPGTDYSYAYNDLVKRLAAPLIETEKIISDQMYKGQPISEKERNSPEYQLRMNFYFSLAVRANYDEALEFSRSFEQRKVDNEKELTAETLRRQTMAPEVIRAFEGLRERVTMPGLPVDQAIQDVINILDPVIKGGLDFKSQELADSYKKLWEGIQPARKIIGDLANEYHDLDDQYGTRDFNPGEEQRYSDLKKVFEGYESQIIQYDNLTSEIEKVLSGDRTLVPERITENVLLNDFYDKDIKGRVSNLERSAYEKDRPGIPLSDPFPARSLTEVRTEVDQLKKDLSKTDRVAFTNSAVLNNEKVIKHIVPKKDRPLTEEDYINSDNGVRTRLARLNARVNNLDEILNMMGDNKQSYQDRYRYETQELTRMCIKHFLDHFDGFTEEKVLLETVSHVDTKNRFESKVMTDQQRTVWEKNMTIINKIESQIFDKINEELTDEKLEEIITALGTTDVFRYTEVNDHTGVGSFQCSY